MPIYEYRCMNCGATFEKLVRNVSSSHELCPMCPQCSSSETCRIPSAFAVTGSQVANAGYTETEPTLTPPEPITPREDIDRWRKLSKKKE